MTDESIKEPPGLREKIAMDQAVKRGELWAAMGYPVSKPHMPQHEYDHDYRGRIWFANELVMDQAQQALKIILCPNCPDKKRHGLSCTRFYITIEDDVMTVFPAVGHFLCHHCGFEEYAPLKSDPRKQKDFEAHIDAMLAARMNPNQLRQLMDAQEAAARQQRMMPPGDYLREMQRRAGVPPMGIGLGGLRSEEEALRRLYQKEMERIAYTKAHPPVINPLINPNKKP